MSDYYEIDFLDVESDKSGDAITIRYSIGGQAYIHVVDGGYQATGPSVAKHIRTHYDSNAYIDHVVATHHDGDHSGGLRTILEEFDVGTLWMLRPWKYSEEIIHRFKRFTNSENLAKALRRAFPNLAALEEIAERRGVRIAEPFQGAAIGAFTVMAPSRERFLDLVVDSERTPDIFEQAAGMVAKIEASVGGLISEALHLIHADWGVEIFSTEPLSTENRMSIVQYANIAGHKILLTGDAGVDGLEEAADFAPQVGLWLPGIDRFQVPHHGSRRNVSTAILDRILGPVLPGPLPKGSEKFRSYISSALKDEAHPRNAVVRAMHHRGGSVAATESNSVHTGHNSPERGWGPVTHLPYPLDQETD